MNVNQKEHKMPSEILSRIPLPSLRVYTSLSVLLVAGCLYYSFNVTMDPSWKQNVNITLHYPPVSLDSLLPDESTAATEEVVNVGPPLSTVKTDDDHHSHGFLNEEEFGGAAELSRTVMDQLQDMVSFMGQEAICIWVSRRLSR